MVKVDISIDKHDIKMKGHANYAPDGSDIVCAAISMCFYNLATVLTKYDKNKAFKDIVIDDDEDGNCHIKLTPTDNYQLLVDHDFMYCIEGLRLIESQYPECIKVRLY